ncbi:MAG: hypothetical protein M0R37_10595 [Bacteroidales bacterium]|jgi:hypothetical protein|nr:hypothetical protein [Bacteroidales bacterium]
MNTIWKAVIVGAALIAVLALGMATAALFDVEVAQSDPEAPVYIDLDELILRYDDPMRGMSGSITYRNVVQDALWYQINNPQVDEETRVELFTVVGVLHEGRSAEITQAQYDMLMDAVQLVWGPAVLSKLAEDMGR